MDPNAQPVQQKNAQPVQQKKPLLSAPLTYVVIIILAIGLGITGYYAGLKQGSTNFAGNSKISLQSNSTVPAGLQKAENSIKTYTGSLLASTRIVQAYTGKLTKLAPEKSWTIEKNGKTITIINDTNNPIQYSIKANSPKIAYQPAATAPFKIGDEIIISTFFGGNGGKVSVDRITLVVPTLPGSAVTKTPLPVPAK